MKQLAKKPAMMTFKTFYNIIYLLNLIIWTIFFDRRDKMFCPKCGALLETYVKYCAGQPIVAYFCPYCHYNSANVEITYSDRSVD